MLCIMNQENIVETRKRKMNINKSRSNDRRVRAQIKMIDVSDSNEDGTRIGFKIKDRVGCYSKRSLKINYKILNKTTFKTTNYGKKRINSRYIKALQVEDQKHTGDQYDYPV